MTNVIKFEELEVEVLTGIANESAELVEASARKAVEHAERCGRALIAIKEKLQHGEWSGWLGQNFEYSQEQARRYMTIASNSTRVWNLKDATSIREALRIIADHPATPKRQGKPSVEVIEVAASIQEVAAELPPPQSFCATTEPVVATSTPAVAKPASPPRHLGEHNESEVFALTKADVAITQLNGIPMKNKFRDAALDRVLSWIDSERTQKCKKPTTSENQ